MTRHGGWTLLVTLLAAACSESGDAASPAPGAADVRTPAVPTDATSSAPAPDPGSDEAEFDSPEERLGAGGRLAFAVFEDRRGTWLDGDGPDPLTACSVLRREPHAAEAVAQLVEGDGGGLMQLFAALADPAAQPGALDAAVAAIVTADGGPDAPVAHAPPPADVAEDPAGPGLDELGPAARFVVDVLERAGQLDESLYEEEFLARAVRVLRADPRSRAAFRYLLGLTDRPRALLVGLCGALAEDPEAFRQAVDAVAAIARDDPPPGPHGEHVAWTAERAPSRDQLRLTAAGRLALDALDGASTFRGPVVGEGGRGIEGFAMSVLLAEREAGAAFRYLEDGSSSAQLLYAACGLRHTDRAAAARLAEKLEQSGGRVRTQFGCIVGEEPVAEIARAIANGDFDRMFRPR